MVIEDSKRPMTYLISQKAESAPKMAVVDDGYRLHRSMVCGRCRRSLNFTRLKDVSIFQCDRHILSGWAAEKSSLRCACFL